MLRDTPLYGAYKALGHYPDYWYWKLRGEPVRSPHLVKQLTVRGYGRQFGLKTLIETGTYYGEMVSAVKNDFDTIYSIEYDAELAKAATTRFARLPHIHILQGDSQVALPELLRSVTQPCLFWLDAGYWGWDQLRRDPERLSLEVEAILGHAVKEHVILMDDARCLNGQKGAITVEELKTRVRGKYPGRTTELKHDIVRITPKR
jgi:hypothetical protein